MSRINSNFEIRTPGDILQEDVEAIVNTVNCVGVMGRGIALQFKNAFPENFNAYRLACERNDVHPGEVFMFATNSTTNPRYIINFPTKRHWRTDSKIEDINTGLKDLKSKIIQHKIRSIAVPPLGCGLGGLNWIDVRKSIESTLGSLKDTKVVVFEPDSSDSSRPTRQKTVPEMNTGRAALIVLTQRYLNGLLDPTISLLEIHKLMYFLCLSGEPEIRKLKFAKHHFGPFSTNLSRVLKAIEGYFLLGYLDGGDQPEKPIKLIPGAVHDANEFLHGRFRTRGRIKRVIRLVAGFETPFGLELLSTVHWVLTHNKPDTIDELYEHVYAWNERKRNFSRRQIDIALERLVSQGWLNNSVTERLDVGDADKWLWHVQRRMSNAARFCFDSFKRGDLTKPV